jgi:hypothetical protein
VTHNEQQALDSARRYLDEQRASKEERGKEANDNARAVIEILDDREGSRVGGAIRLLMDAYEVERLVGTGRRRDATALLLELDTKVSQLYGDGACPWRSDPIVGQIVRVLVGQYFALIGGNEPGEEAGVERAAAMFAATRLVPTMMSQLDEINYPVLASQIYLTHAEFYQWYAKLIVTEPAHGEYAQIAQRSLELARAVIR